jgi:hypothetical protein
MKPFHPRVAAGAEGSRRRGLSLVEVVLASTIFTGIAYVLSLSMRANDQSYDTILQTSDSNAAMREMTTVLSDELKAASRPTIQVQDFGGFSRLEFSYAIASAGPDPMWGVFERELSLQEDECSREGWTVRYFADPAAGPTRPLVRSILDDKRKVHHTRILAENVETFSVTPSGDVWVVRVTTRTDEGRHEEEFDVRTRDQSPGSQVLSPEPTTFEATTGDTLKGKPNR